MSGLNVDSGADAVNGLVREDLFMAETMKPGELLLLGKVLQRYYFKGKEIQQETQGNLIVD